jgi:hypothetical protein
MKRARRRFELAWVDDRRYLLRPFQSMIVSVEVKRSGVIVFLSKTAQF